MVTVESKGLTTIVRIEDDGYKIELHGDYTPHEEPTQNYPGCVEHFTVEEIKCSDSDVMELLKMFHVAGEKGLSFEEFLTSVALDGLHQWQKENVPDID